MLFQYDVPDKEFYYADGKTWTTYYPAIEQATQKPIKESDDERLRIFLIPWNQEWQGQFEQIGLTALTPVKPGNRIVQLTPKKPDEIPVIFVEVNPANRFLIDRFFLKYPDGGTTEFQFQNISTEPLDASLFVFKAPPGVQVIKDR
jgi:outer membrane lipoprotein-sorting protein